MTSVGLNSYSVNDSDSYKTSMNNFVSQNQIESGAASSQNPEPTGSNLSAFRPDQDSFAASDELKEMNAEDETSQMLAWNTDDEAMTTDGQYLDKAAYKDTVKNLLSNKDQKAAFNDWKSIPVKQRKEIYDSLDNNMKRALNDKTSNWVRKEALDNLSKENQGTFSTFGANMNLVPKIGFENDPEKKARLAAHEYGDLMNSAVGDYNGLRTVCVRMQHPIDASNNYVSTVNRGGGACGEMSLSLVDTFNGVFGNKQYPANKNHRVDCCQILGTGPWGTNHASTDLNIDGKHFVSDPAWYAQSKKSFEGFGESEWVNKPEKDWVNFWSKSKAWGHALDKFVLEDGTPKGNQIYP